MQYDTKRKPITEINLRQNRNRVIGMRRPKRWGSEEEKAARVGTNCWGRGGKVGGGAHSEGGSGQIE